MTDPREDVVEPDTYEGILEAWRSGLQPNEQDIEVLFSEITRLRRALGFFRSVILSGEEWTETCERTYTNATPAPEGEE